MNHIQTNIIFFMQDIDTPEFDFDCFKVRDCIEKRYDTPVYMMGYDIIQRTSKAIASNKKFGLVLRSLKP